MRMQSAITLVTLSMHIVAGQTFVYTNNERTDPVNTISAFSVASSGSMTEIPGSPFPTGGVGAAGKSFGSNHILVTTQGFLVAANGGSQTLSVFSVNPASGRPAPVAGSPFATGEQIVPSEPDISLAATPDGKYLITGHNSNGHLNVFTIGPNGALSRTANSPLNIGGPGLAGIAVTANGRFLAVAELSRGVGMFAISTSGDLTPVPGTPVQVVPPGFAGKNIFASSVDCNCSSTQLFEGKFNDVGRIVAGVFNISPGGGLIPVPGSPFVFSEGDNSSVIALSADDRFAFISNQNSRTVSSFSIGASGALTLVPPLVQISDVFPAGPSTPIGLTVDAAGRFLFEANSTNTVGSLQIGANGSLTKAPGSPVSTGYTGFGLGSVAAYPAKSCCAAPKVTSLAASPNSLWPPDHKLVPVALQYEVSAECAVRTQVTVTGSDPADQVVVDNRHLLLRADKDKVYTITVTVTNVINRETGSATMQVVVPHDQGH